MNWATKRTTMKTTLSLFLLVFFAMNSVCVLSQTDPQTNLRYNRAALRFYNGVEIERFQQDAAQDYDALLYYFTSSFEVRYINCTRECDIDYNAFYNQDLFNVVFHESKRELNNPVTFEFKEKYEITLKPENEVLSNCNGHQLSELTSLVVSRPLPQWESTGNDSLDYQTYRVALQSWTQDFPEEFRALTSGQGLRKIKINEFLSLPENRREAFTTGVGTYIIMD
jgi:hypothetical protein